MKHIAHHLSKQSGYTLIEIVVSVGILVLMLGGGIAAFIQFQEKQAIVAATNDLKVQLRVAQTRARTGDTPDDCDRLQSYAVRTNTSNGVTQMTMLAMCNSGEIVRKEQDLLSGVTLANDIDIRFLTLHGGVSGAATINLVSDTGYEYEFEVTQGGEITEGRFITQEEAVVASPSPSASVAAFPSPSPSASPSPSPSPSPSGFSGRGFPSPSPSGGCYLCM
jgi:type II secretory pathway pseudopilin PulG